MPSWWPAVLVAGVFGAFVGSFLNVLIWRLPRNLEAISAPSRCPHCGTRLAWFENLPVLGWLLLRGRCRHCGSPIHPRYIAAELAIAALTAGIVALCLAPPPWAVPAFGGLWVPGDLRPIAAAAGLLALAWYLVAISAIDLAHQIIPDELSLGMQAAAPLLAALACNVGMTWDPSAWAARQDLFGGFAATPGVLTLWLGSAVAASALLLAGSERILRRVYERYMAPGEPWSAEDTRGLVAGIRWFQIVVAAWTAATLALAWSADAWPAAARLPALAAAVQLAQAVLGMIAGWWILYAVGLAGTVAFRRNAMGFGDVKLLAPLGAFLGPVGVLYGFAFAAIIGAAVGIAVLALRRGNLIPFGPSLALGCVLAMGLAAPLHHRLFP